MLVTGTAEIDGVLMKVLQCNHCLEEIDVFGTLMWVAITRTVEAVRAEK